MLSKRSACCLVATIAVVGLLCLSSSPAAAQSSGRPTVLQSRHAVSPALRDLVPQPLTHLENEEVAVRQVRPHTPNFKFVDQALQQTQGPLLGSFSGLNFEGIGANGYAPSDDNSAVGKTQVVQWVNVEYEVFDKATGVSLLG